MTKGVVLIARNNSKVDYIKQAVFNAKRIKKYLNLPVCLITDNKNYLEKNFENIFDSVIEVENNTNYTNKKYYDGSFSKYVIEFKNINRSSVYDLTPYDETIVLDTDFIIGNDVFLNCFNQSHDFLIYNRSFDLSGQRDTFEFQYITEPGPTFYWATAFFFRKTSVNKIFFDLVKHIQDNWTYYRNLYQITSAVFRNDFAFSIAIHIMNGYTKAEFAKSMPGTMFYATDRDVLLEINDNTFKILIENEKSFGNYFPVKITNSNVHIMNKFSLGRVIDNDC